MNVGLRIKLRRIELGMTQEQLAKKIGFAHKASISHAENDRYESMTTRKLSKFAEALNCTESYLMGYETENADEVLLAKITKDAGLQTMIKLFMDLSPEHQGDILKLIEQFTTIEKR